MVSKRNTTDDFDKILNYSKTSAKHNFYIIFVIFKAGYLRRMGALHLPDYETSTPLVTRTHNQVREILFLLSLGGTVPQFVLNYV